MRSAPVAAAAPALIASICARLAGASRWSSWAPSSANPPSQHGRLRLRDGPRFRRCRGLASAVLRAASARAAYGGGPTHAGR
jgi:hypothetical protein